MFYVHPHENFSFHRGGAESGSGYLFSSCFLHWYLSYLEKSRPASLRKTFTESEVVGILIFEPSLGHLYFPLSWANNIGARVSLGGSGMYLATGVILFVPLILGCCW